MKDPPKDLTEALRRNGKEPDFDGFLARKAKPGGNRSPSGLVYASTYNPRPITFLDNTTRFPMGHVTTIAGDGGVGKSLLAAREAALVSQRGDGVIFLLAEDDPASTWVPRLMAHGADLSRIAVLRVHRSSEGVEWEDTPLIPGELPRVRKAIEEMNAKLSPHQVRLLVIDPLEAHLDDPRDDGNSSIARRRALGPLDATASTYGLAAVPLHHLTKSVGQQARHRLLGSVANRNAVRSLIFFGPDPDEEVEEGKTGARRVEVHEKANLSIPWPSRLYEITTVEVAGIMVPRLDYLHEVDVDLERVLGAPATHEEKTEREEAGDFLRKMLGDGERPTKEVMREGKALFSEATLKRARRDVGVRTRDVKDSNGKIQHWVLYINDPVDPEDHGVIPWPTGEEHEPLDDDPESLDSSHSDPEPRPEGQPHISMSGDPLDSWERVLDCPACGKSQPPDKIAAGLAYCKCGNYHAPWPEEEP